jgi:hypothetical protein
MTRAEHWNLDQELMPLRRQHSDCHNHGRMIVERLADKLRRPLGDGG